MTVSMGIPGLGEVDPGTHICALRAVPSLITLYGVAHVQRLYPTQRGIQTAIDPTNYGDKMIKSSEIWRRE